MNIQSRPVTASAVIRALIDEPFPLQILIKDLTCEWSRQLAKFWKLSRSAYLCRLYAPLNPPCEAGKSQILLLFRANFAGWRVLHTEDSSNISTHIASYYVLWTQGMFHLLACTIADLHSTSTVRDKLSTIIIVQLFPILLKLNSIVFSGTFIGTWLYDEKRKKMISASEIEAQSDYDQICSKGVSM